MSDRYSYSSLSIVDKSLANSTLDLFFSNIIDCEPDLVIRIVLYV